jgi:Family of unknown function (DUF6494)
MNQDVFNMSVRKFLKEFAVSAQREIGNTVREALSKGTGKKKLPVKITFDPGSDQSAFGCRWRDRARIALSASHYTRHSR